MTFGHQVGCSKALHIFIRKVDVANDTVKVNGSDLAMTGANIDTVVFAHDGIKQIDWANMEEVNADGPWLAYLT